MKINKVTITGADDKVNIDDLVDLSKRFPFVEWGILFSKTKIRTNRYPPKSKIEQIQINDSVWIDMESGIRTNDEFDLVKVEKVLQSI